jgi:hypothetical protein
MNFVRKGGSGKTQVIVWQPLEFYIFLAVTGKFTTTGKRTISLQETMRGV